MSIRKKINPQRNTAGYELAGGFRSGIPLEKAHFDALGLMKTVKYVNNHIIQTANRRQLNNGLIMQHFQRQHPSHTRMPTLECTH